VWALGVSFDIPPSTKTSQTIHLHETESEDTAESGRDHAEKVEDRVSLSHVVADVPGREQVYAALKLSSARDVILSHLSIFTHGEETSLKETQDHTTRGQSSPVIRETHANHDGAPCYAQTCEEVARTNLAGENGGWRLEHDICDEEDEGHDRLRFAKIVSVAIPGTIFDTLKVDSHISSANQA
jgi:hypothetical protein